MGEVFLGRSPGGRPVAVKVIRPGIAAHARFAREVEAARRVGGFHTAQVVDADAEARPPWLVTAYVAGPSLREAVEEHGPLPAHTVLALGAGLVEGLGAVHACGIVHRDLKPANVLIASDGPRIIDFGIARAVDASLITASGSMVGTPGYMSPEQVRGEHELDPASDVFSLGCVLAYAATGTGPFEAGSTAGAIQRILFSEPDLSLVPDGVRELVADCLAKDPAKRPGVDDLARRLAGKAAGPGWLPTAVDSMVAERSVELPTSPDVPGAPPTRKDARHRPRPAKRWRRRYLVGALAAAVCTIVSAGAVAAWASGFPSRGSHESSSPRLVAPPIASAPTSASTAPTATPTTGGTDRTSGAEPTADDSSGASPARTPVRKAGPSSAPWTNCRPYVPVARAQLAIDPCVRLSRHGLDMVVNVRALSSAGTSGTVSVWVWVANETNSKYRASLHRCRVSLASSEDEGMCGPFSYTPDGSGTYHVAASAARSGQALPPEWPPQFTGTGTQPVTWSG
ncbi:serine/threonine protein kinase [Actinomadura logoneensis]|uniref:Serine/threonine protein kinase n=2 Tax=Actinomadura logoneensis TaxID=2293572 RepID=A0A372JRY7_9ACTN|nr:serine/threonine protein kinase [Actinomadura logoneensis]